MNIRSQKIIQILLQNEEPISDKDIANQLNVSKRTIQREYDALEYELKSYNVELIRKKGKGISLSGSPTDLFYLKESLEVEDELDSSDVNQRRSALILEILQQQEPTKLMYYANALHVSESTIGTDIEAIEPWFEKSRLEIVRRQGYGIQVVGKESDIREAIGRWFHENSKLDKRLSLLQRIEEEKYPMLDKDTLKRVYRILESIHDSRLNQFTDAAYTALLIHITICVYRVKNEAYIQHDSSYKQSQSEDYELAKRIIRTLEMEFNIQIPEEEISYLMLHIEGSKMNYSSQISDSYPEQVIFDMIDAYDPLISESLSQDMDFINGLLIHLKPVMVRIENHLNIFNPLLEQVKEQYPDIYQKTQRAALVLEKETGYEVSEEEIGYLAMHFGAAERRLKRQSLVLRTVDIGVVCASGFGVSRLMMTVLKNKLGNSVHLESLSMEDMKQRDMDFYVSTFELKDVDHIVVNPMINDSDLDKIQKKVNHYAVSSKEQESHFQEKMEQVGFLSSEIETILKDYHNVILNKKSTFNDVLRYIYQETGSQEIVNQIRKREKSGTQVIPELGLVLLHTRAHISKTVLFTIQAENHACFESDYFKKCRVVICMVIPYSPHVLISSDLFGNISSELIENESFLETLQTKNEGDIHRELEHILQSYFYRFIQSE